jgi:mRNA-degrading endonuclease toxin of MazEF toxin-antitoxin module
MPQPRLRHGDVFIAQLDPTVGEIRKTRPVVIISNNANCNRENTKGRKHKAEMHITAPLASRAGSVH